MKDELNDVLTEVIDLLQLTCTIPSSRASV